MFQTEESFKHNFSYREGEKYKLEIKNKQTNKANKRILPGRVRTSNHNPRILSYSAQSLAGGFPPPTCTISQEGGSHEADERRSKFQHKPGLRGSEQLWKLPSPRATAFGLPRLPSPHSSLVLAGAAPAWALGAYKDGVCVTTQFLPCEKAWPTHRQLEVTSTPDDTVQSLLCLAF